MIPSGDEFEKRMQQFIKEDDVVLLERICLKRTYRQGETRWLLKENASA
jgi:hypothetical protein